MASSSTNKTVWTLAGIAVMAFLVLKLWPSIANALGGLSGGGGGGGGVGQSTGSSSGGGYPYLYQPYNQNPLQAALSSIPGVGSVLSSLFGGNSGSINSLTGATPQSLSLASENTPAIYNAEDAGYGYSGSVDAYNPNYGYGVDNPVGPPDSGAGDGGGGTSDYYDPSDPEGYDDSGDTGGE